MIHGRSSLNIDRSGQNSLHVVHDKTMTGAKRAFVTNQVILRIFLFLVFTRKSIVAKDPTTCKVFDNAIQLLTNCMFPYWKNVLIVENVFLDDDLKKLHETNQCVITVLGDTRTRDDRHVTDAMFWLPTFISDRYYAKVYTLEIFVIKVTSSSSLVKELDRIKNSLWHNARGKFIILDDNPESDKCRMAYEHLHTAWQYNLLSVLFLCEDASGTVKIYTYNPFGEYAPEPWKIVSQDSDDRSGSLFVLGDRNLKIVNDRDECKNIFYDKCVKLYGYPIRVLGKLYPPTLYIDNNETIEKRYTGEDGIITTNLIADMNATMIDDAHLWSHINDFGYFYENGTYYGILKPLALDEIDIGINSRTLMVHWNLTLLYPHTQVPLCIISKDRGNVPQWKRLLKIFDLPTITGLAVVLTTVLLIYEYTSGLCFVLNFLEIIRMVVGTSIRHLPSRNSIRIVHGSVFLLLLVFSAAFNGNFMSLLTTPLKRKNMDTPRDLDYYGYKIIGYPTFKSYFKDHPRLLARYESDLGLYCFENIHRLNKAACIAHCLFTDIFFSLNKNVHKFVLTSALSHATLLARRDWPLADRANVMLQRYVETGYVKFSSDMVLYEVESKRWTYLRSQQPDKIKVIVLKDLAFIFCFLLAGLACSALVLFYEIFNARKP